MGPSMHHEDFPICHFVRNYTHNSKTKGRMRTFYLSNNCSTIGHINSLGESCMQDTIGELYIQNRITTTFRYNILCVLTLVTQKLQVLCRRSTYQTTVLLSKMSIFCVRAGWGILLVSYASQHTLQSLSNKPFVSMQLYGHFTYWTTAKLSETFFVWFRVAWEIWLESYGPRQASVILW